MLKLGLGLVTAMAASASAEPLDAGDLFRAARVLARQGKCEQVTLVAERVRQLDPGMYRFELVEDRDVARCLPAQPEPPAQPETASDSYRMQMVIGDVIGVAAGSLIGQLVGGREGGAVFGGFAGFVLSGAVTHIREHHGNAAAISIASRLALPILGYYLGDAVGPSNTCPRSSGSGCGTIPGITYGVVGGLVAAIAIDYSALPYHAVPAVDHTQTATTVGIAMAF